MCVCVRTSFFDQVRPIATGRDGLYCASRERDKEAKKERDRERERELRKVALTSRFFSF